jgi:mono/diheme cytochrome c family protein
MRLTLAAPVVAALVMATPAFAAEQEVTLRPGPGVELMAQHCAACHSADYVRTNAPFLTAEVWKAEVTKMRVAYGAPIDDDDAARIVAYLAATYAAK